MASSWQGSGTVLTRVGRCKVLWLSRSAPRMAPLLKLLARRIYGKTFELIFEPGQAVVALDVKAFFPGFAAAAAADQALCLPLLGVLMRTESRKL